MPQPSDMEGKPFLGTGWSFPPVFDRRSGEVVMVSGENDIKESLRILLSTSMGERVMQPEYGCDLTEYQFEPLNATLVTFLSDLVEKAILYFEPRIRVERIEITPVHSTEYLEGRVEIDMYLEGRVQIDIHYVVASTNSRFNFVFDFYLREANVSVPA